MAVASTGRDKTKDELVTIKEALVTDQLLEAILLQLKINNAHLALITGEEAFDGSSD